MSPLLHELFSNDGFMPHGHCYFWTSGLVWLHVVSDALIALAYYSIPFSLLLFVRRRHDLNFRWIFGMFAVFILACGTTHLLEIWNVWHSYYWLSGGVKAVTAAASVVTALLLARLVPQALALPSPASLRQANARLELEIAQRTAAEERANVLNAELEERVRTRTAELETMNGELQRQIGESKRHQIAQEQLAAIVESSSDAIIGTDLAGKITSWNAGAEHMLQSTAGEMMGGSCMDIIRPQERARGRAILERIRRGELIPAFDTMAICKNGELVEVSLSISPIRDADGVVIGASKVARNVSERKRALRALRQSEERLKAVTENLSEGLLIAEMDGRLIHWNRACLELHGLEKLEDGLAPLEEFMAVFELSTLDGRLLPFEEWPLRQVLAGATLRNHEVRIRHRKTGLERIFSYSGSVVHEVADAPLAFVAINDITERKQAQRALQQLNAELETRVARRTEQLEAANKELEAFSYSVSHDLRAPLRAISGFSQAVQEDYAHLLPEEGRRYISNVEAGAKRMGQLIDDLLTFSRLSRLPIRRRPVDMARLVEEALEELRPEREGRQIEIRIGKLPPCDGDPSLLKQVWVNLLSNALKYTRKCEHARVEIEGAQTGHGPSYTVRDNGSGFDMRYASKLFGVFQRLHRAEEFEGTGVGLAIVQRVIHRHGGEITAEATPQLGATFSFTMNSKPKP